MCNEFVKGQIMLPLCTNFGFKFLLSCIVLICCIRRGQPTTEQPLYPFEFDEYDDDAHEDESYMEKSPSYSTHRESPTHQDYSPSAIKDLPDSFSPWPRSPHHDDSVHKSSEHSPIMERHYSQQKSPQTFYYYESTHTKKKGAHHSPWKSWEWNHHSPWKNKPGTHPKSPTKGHHPKRPNSPVTYTSYYYTSEGGKKKPPKSNPSETHSVESIEHEYWDPSHKTSHHEPKKKTPEDEFEPDDDFEDFTDYTFEDDTKDTRKDSPKEKPKDEPSIETYYDILEPKNLTESKKFKYPPHTVVEETIEKWRRKPHRGEDKILKYPKYKRRQMQTNTTPIPGEPTNPSTAFDYYFDIEGNTKTLPSETTTTKSPTSPDGEVDKIWSEKIWLRRPGKKKTPTTDTFQETATQPTDAGDQKTTPTDTDTTEDIMRKKYYRYTHPKNTTDSTGSMTTPMPERFTTEKTEYFYYYWDGFKRRRKPRKFTTSAQGTEMATTMPTQNQFTTTPSSEEKKSYWDSIKLRRKKITTASTQPTTTTMTSGDSFTTRSTDDPDLFYTTPATNSDVYLTWKPKNKPDHILKFKRKGQLQTTQSGATTTSADKIEKTTDPATLNEEISTTSSSTPEKQSERVETTTTSSTKTTGDENPTDGITIASTTASVTPPTTDIGKIKLYTPGRRSNSGLLWTSQQTTATVESGNEVTTEVPENSKDQSTEHAGRQKTTTSQSGENFTPQSDGEELLSTASTTETIIDTTENVAEKDPGVTSTLVSGSDTTTRLPSTPKEGEIAKTPFQPSTAETPSVDKRTLENNSEKVTDTDKTMEPTSTRSSITRPKSPGRHPQQSQTVITERTPSHTTQNEENTDNQQTHSEVEAISTTPSSLGQTETEFPRPLSDDIPTTGDFLPESQNLTDFPELSESWIPPENFFPERWPTAFGQPSNATSDLSNDTADPLWQYPQSPDSTPKPSKEGENKFVPNRPYVVYKGRIPYYTKPQVLEQAMQPSQGGQQQSRAALLAMMRRQLSALLAMAYARSMGANAALTLSKRQALLILLRLAKHTGQQYAQIFLLAYQRIQASTRTIITLSEIDVLVYQCLIYKLQLLKTMQMRMAQHNYLAELARRLQNAHLRYHRRRHRYNRRQQRFRTTVAPPPQTGYKMESTKQGTLTEETSTTTETNIHDTSSEEGNFTVNADVGENDKLDDTSEEFFEEALHQSKSKGAVHQHHKYREHDDRSSVKKLHSSATSQKLTTEAIPKEQIEISKQSTSKSIGGTKIVHHKKIRLIKKVVEIKRSVKVPA